MENIVMDFMKKNELIKKNSTVCIGVSGGPDSIALLHYFVSLRELWNLRLFALSADHQLRGAESQKDLEYVKAMCEKWNVDCIDTRLDVQAYQNIQQVGTQVAARELRYRFFSEQMKQLNADYLALGHHGDDQVETMLMSFARSASTVSLSGIPMKRAFGSGFIIRPFLCVTKNMIHTYCRSHHIIPRIDPSNKDTNYTRNYFRKHIIPLIKAKNNNIHVIAQHLSMSLQDDEKHLQDEAKKMLSEVVNFNEKRQIASFEIKQFKSYSLSLQRRSFHLILNYLYNKLPENLSYVHEEIFFSLLSEERSNIRLDFPHQLQVEKSYDQITFVFPQDTKTVLPFHELLTVPGNVTLPDGSMVIASYEEKSMKGQDDVFICAAEDIVLPLHIRSRKPGDRMTWKGLAGSKKVKDIFIDEKVHRKERDTWPIVTDHNNEILWLIGLRKGRQIENNKGPFIKLIFKKGNE